MKKIIIIFFSSFGIFSPLFCGPGYFDNVVNAAGTLAKSPFVLAGAILGVSSYEEEQAARHREQERREQQAAREREDAHRRKAQALEKLDNDIHSIQESTRRKEDQIIDLQQKRLPELEKLMTEAENQKRLWQKTSQDRVQSVTELSIQLKSCTEAYRQEELSLKAEHDSRINQLVQEYETKTEQVQRTHEKESESWQKKLAQAATEEQSLQDVKDDLEAQNDVLSAQRKKEKRTLTTLVIQAISYPKNGKTVSTDNVLEALDVLGRNKEILHATEHAQNVSLLVALILSGHFKTDDLSSDGSDFESIPKSFFKKSRNELQNQISTEDKKEKNLDEWLTTLKKLGQSKFLCCSC